jgi:MoxR-like ATPase
MDSSPTPASVPNVDEILDARVPGDPDDGSLIDERQAAEVIGRIAGGLNRVLHGQREVVRKLLAAFASGGHVLLDDVPGTGKTTAAKALAQITQASFQRIQFTPDLLPGDILGVSIFDPRDQGFHFHKGPVFADVLLADEVNRASPRTQSALLEAMAEKQVTVDRVRHALTDSFFVIATQNPLEFQGTYALPESQMDRFAMRLRLGFVSAQNEVAILDDQAAGGSPLETIQVRATAQQVSALRSAAARVRVSQEVKRYIVALTAASRRAPGVLHGASPRASLALMKTAQALALFDGQGFVTPELVQTVAVDVIAHRLVLDGQARYAGRSAEVVVHEIVEQVAPPR